MRVKVCGIKSVEDAKLAASSGADAIGLLVGQMHSSNDFVSEEVAREIVKECSLYVTPVLVTHLRNPKQIYNIASYTGINVIQLHSNCSIIDIRRLRAMFAMGAYQQNIKLIKSIHANGSAPPKLFDDLQTLQNDVDAIIVDTLDKEGDRVGGTGKSHDWNISQQVVASSKRPVFLAGGLGPDNVRKAIKFVKPYGVDANSCLKASNGYKDENKVSDFIFNAKLEFLQAFKRLTLCAR